MIYGDLIEMEFLLMSEWNFGSALAVVMLILTSTVYVADVQIR